MAITVYCLRRDLDHDRSLKVTDPLVSNWEAEMAAGTYSEKKAKARGDAVRFEFANDGYEAVARVDGDDRDHVWTRIQNGAVHPSRRISLLSEAQRGRYSDDDVHDAIDDLESGNVSHDRINPEMREIIALLSSWSRLPDPDVTVLGEPAIVGREGKLFGRRSMMVGDVLEQEDGRRFVVQSFGFSEIAAEKA